MKDTSISYCDHSWSGWRGCTKVAPGCHHCFAEALAKRFPSVMGTWGPNGTRIRATDAYWGQPLKWDAVARRELDDYWHMMSTTFRDRSDQIGMGKPDRPRVLWDLSDPFEDWSGPILDHRGARVEIAPNMTLTMDNMRADFFRLIEKTSNLDWLLLTKRPENIRRMMAGVTERVENIWLGCSVSDQKTADKLIPELLRCRDLSPVLWVSIEPMIGSVNLELRNTGMMLSRQGVSLDPWNTLAGTCGSLTTAKIGWVVIGGESGSHRRPCKIEWIADVADQCSRAGVPCFVKQDSALKPGQQGRIPDELWDVKELPK